MRVSKFLIILSDFDKKLARNGYSSEMGNDRESFMGCTNTHWAPRRARRIVYVLAVPAINPYDNMSTCWPSRTRATVTAESVRGKCRTDAKLLPGSHSSPCHVRCFIRVCAKGRGRNYRKRYLPKGNN